MPTVLPGLDRLRAQHLGAAQDHFKYLHGKRLGLLSNHTGATQDGVAGRQVLEDIGLNVAAIFAPEHGLAGTEEGHIESGALGKLPVHSLYGKTRRPTPEMLDGIDVLVCDLQDVGVRFYTYTSTVAICLEECLPRGIAVVILDRPNPLGGLVVAGPMVDESRRSFVGHLREPVQPGLTLGELARLHKEDGKLSGDLRVVECEGWTRAMTWPATGLKWIAPSPNLPDFLSTAWYPGLCLCEFSAVAVGRGTDAPFQRVGAPWLEPSRVLQVLAPLLAKAGGDVSGEPEVFTPKSPTHPHDGVECQGVRLRSSRADGAPSDPVAIGLALLTALHQVHPEQFKLDKCIQLLGSDAVLESVRAGDFDGALARSKADAKRFEERRRSVLVYK